MLRLDAMTLRGVGSYLQGSRLEFRPLTILSGTNGAGKSTWFKALSLLRRSAVKGLLPFAFAVDDHFAGSVEFMNYPLYCSSDLSDTANGADEDRFGPPACIGMELVATEGMRLGRPHGTPARPEDPVERLVVAGSCSPGTRLRVRLAHPTSDVDSHLLETTPGMHHLIELAVNGDVFAFQRQHRPGRDNAGIGEYRQFRCPPRFSRMPEDRLRDAVATRVQEIVRSFFRGYFHISAVRSLGKQTDFKLALPPRSSHQRRDVRPNGRRSLDVFFWNYRAESPGDLTDEQGSLVFAGLERRVSEPLRDLLGIGMEGEWEAGTLSRFVNRYLGGPQTPKQLSSGFHQLFPIFVQLGVMRPGELLSIENPEVHLHPDLQLRVSEFLLEQSRRGRRVVIETHSDLIIRRVVRALLAEENGLSQQHVSLNFAMPHNDALGRIGSVLQQFGVDEGGRIEWPEGFMDASINEAERLMEVMYGSRRQPHEGEASE